MTTATFSLAELRAAYTALHAGAFTTDTTPQPETAAAATAELPAAAEAVVGVVGVSGGVGTTTVALAIAEALGAGRLVELSVPHTSGLAVASTAELGTQDGWSVGSRDGLRLERRADPDATILPDTAAGLTVLDLGTWTEPQPAVSVLVVVAACSVPSVRRLNARLDTLDGLRVVPVITGVPGRALPKPVGSVCGPRLPAAATAGRLLLVPECASLRVGGVTADPLPRRLQSAVDVIKSCVEEIS
ncbi:hypothetical protein [Tessaracoccus sp. Y1736]